MHAIRNVEIDHCDIDPLAWSTSEVSSCITAMIEMKDNIFMYHAVPRNFNAPLKCSVSDTYKFLTKIYNHVHRLNANAMVENVYLIGGWNNMNYWTLRNQINRIRDQCIMTMKQNSALASNNFDISVSKIAVNLIGFSLSAKKLDGTDKKEDDDDNPDDYIFDCTIT